MVGIEKRALVLLRMKIQFEIPILHAVLLEEKSITALITVKVDLFRHFIGKNSVISMNLLLYLQLPYVARSAVFGILVNFLVQNIGSWNFEILHCGV